MMSTGSRLRHQQATPPTKEGPLLKYRNFWAGWSIRYFKLDKCYLHYFETKHAPEPIDSLPRGCIVGAKPSDGFPDKEFVFEIQQKSGTIWYAQASSMEDMIEWLRALSPVPLVLNPDMYPTTTITEARRDAGQIDVIASAPPSNDFARIYPNLPHEIYYEYHGNRQQLFSAEAANGIAPPPYSDTVNDSRR